MHRLFALVLLCVSVVLPGIAPAGSSEAGKPILPADQVAEFSNSVQHYLAHNGANIAIVARVGRDPSVLPAGITYTHVAYWVYSEITQADGRRGRGYRVYNLYQTPENAARSSLVQDSPADFFAGAHSLDAGVIIPDPRLQRKLLNVIAAGTYDGLHNPNYAVLANPKTRQFQNCTEHTLDVLVAAVYGIDDPDQIKANIAAHFVPQPIQIGGLKRSLATISSAALTTQDHGSRVATTTFGTLARFMAEHGLSKSTVRLTPQGVRTF